MKKRYENITDGFYTIVYSNGEHRTIRVRTITYGGMKGKTVVGYLKGQGVGDYENFAFLEDGHLNFWVRFIREQDPVRLDRIERAIEIIDGNIRGTGHAYALRSGNCCRCNRVLTNPDSIALGIGPECAKREAVPTNREAVDGAYNVFMKSARPAAEKVAGIRIN